VGAQCANRARWDLCGGCPVTGIPAAITGRCQSPTGPATRRKGKSRPITEVAPLHLSDCFEAGCRYALHPDERRRQSMSATARGGNPCVATAATRR
jgi:hypothetical protein